MNNKTRKRVIIASIILLYNMVGLITVCSIMSSDPYYGEWTIWMSILTFPVIIASFIYRYMQAEPLYPIFIIQSIILILSLYLGNFLIKRDKH